MDDQGYEGESETVHHCSQQLHLLPALDYDWEHLVHLEAVQDLTMLQDCSLEAV